MKITHDILDDIIDGKDTVEMYKNKRKPHKKGKGFDVLSNISDKMKDLGKGEKEREKTSETHKTAQKHKKPIQKPKSIQKMNTQNLEQSKIEEDKRKKLAQLANSINLRKR